MPVQLNKVQPDVRMIEMAILKEAAGCSYEDTQVRSYNYSMLSGVVLHLNALAKRMLGIYGQAIGNDPRREHQMQGVSYRDWSAERAAVDRDDNPHRAQQVADLERDIERSNRLAAEFDREAWDAVLELEEVLKRRAMALTRTNPPLLAFSQDDLPNEVALTEKQLGGKMNMPSENTVEITREGVRFLGSGKRLIPAKNQLSQSRFDEDLEIEGGWDF